MYAKMFSCFGSILRKLAPAFAAALLLASCGMMDDVGDDCSTDKRIYFRYDYNMLFADAFPHEVKTLTLYAFNDSGRVVYTRHASTESIIAKGYMDVSDLPSGKYNFQVWAEGEQRQADTYLYGADQAAAAGNSALQQPQLTASINRNGTEINHDLTPLYYGRLNNADFTDFRTRGRREATIYLRKDTELFRIVLQNLSGDSLKADDFSFYITDNNGSLDADNNIITPADTLTYRAWAQYSGSAGISSGDNPETITGINTVVAEITTNRLVRELNSRKHNMILHVVRHSDAKEIVRINLTDACLLVKGNYNRSMSDQEYLDRQDTWDFVFFLDANRNWLAARIYVQQWMVVLQSSDLGA